MSTKPNNPASLWVFLLMVLGITLSTSVGAAAAAPTGDPVAAGCSGRTVWQQQIIGYGTIEVRYSDGCGTNWIRVTGATGRPSEAGIWSARSGWQYSPSWQSSPSQYWTPMVYAPGSECIQFRVKIVKYGGQLYDTGYKQLC